MRPFALAAAATLVLAGACNGAGEPASTPTPAASPTAPASPTPTTDPTASARAFVSDFMDARVARDEARARTFLSPGAAQAYDDGDDGLTLIGTSNPHFASWAFVSFEQADANSFEVVVEVTEEFTGSGEKSTFEETLFVGPGADLDGEQRPFVIRGAVRRSP